MSQEKRCDKCKKSNTCFLLRMFCIAIGAFQNIGLGVPYSSNSISKAIHWFYEFASFCDHYES